MKSKRWDIWTLSAHTGDQEVELAEVKEELQKKIYHIADLQRIISHAYAHFEREKANSTKEADELLYRIIKGMTHE